MVQVSRPKECEMSTARFTVSLGERLNSQLEAIIGEDDESKAQAMRKAVQLYIVSKQAARDGKKVGIAKPGTDLATEFINL
jgi:metal-responsive CopG/Arc/MetJ family transcriptional regulator